LIEVRNFKGIDRGKKIIPRKTENGALQQHH